MNESEKFIEEFYYEIYLWMTIKEPNGLGLKGLELLIYAIIFKYTGDGFKNINVAGKSKLFAELTGSTPRGCRKALNNLIKKGYISKIEPADGCLVQINKR